MSSLWQRMGRGSRNLLREAIAVIFAESKTFDSVRAEKEEKKRKREETKAAKQAAKSVGSSGNTERPRKRQRTESEKENSPPEQNSQAAIINSAEEEVNEEMADLDEETIDVPPPNNSHAALLQPQQPPQQPILLPFSLLNNSEVAARRCTIGSIAIGINGGGRGGAKGLVEVAVRRKMSMRSTPRSRTSSMHLSVDLGVVEYQHTSCSKRSLLVRKYRSHTLQY